MCGVRNHIINDNVRNTSTSSSKNNTNTCNSNSSILVLIIVIVIAVLVLVIVKVILVLGHHAARADPARRQLPDRGVADVLREGEVDT